MPRPTLAIRLSASNFETTGLVVQWGFHANYPGPVVTNLANSVRYLDPVVECGSMEIDLHGYHPRDVVWSGVLAKVVRQAWEMGESHLCFIHGHGRNRGISPGFVNTNTGYFGLEIRRALRHEQDLRRWILHTTLDCERPGCTTIKLRPNDAPTRTMLDSDLLP